MKTKKQLFEAATKGPLHNRVLFEILDVITDLRNIIIACKLEEEGVDIEPVKAEMKRLYEAEVRDG